MRGIVRGRPIETFLGPEMDGGGGGGEGTFEPQPDGQLTQITSYRAHS